MILCSRGAEFRAPERLGFGKEGFGDLRTTPEYVINLSNTETALLKS